MKTEIERIFNSIVEDPELFEDRREYDTNDLMSRYLITAEDAQELFDAIQLKAKEPEGEIFCFECGRFVQASDWLKNPTDNYGCSRHV